jgi:hypothetical protein
MSQTRPLTTSHISNHMINSAQQNLSQGLGHLISQGHQQIRN